jgi:chitin synthase
MDNNYIQRGNTLRRGRTLVRPDRQQGPAPMLDGSKERKPLDPWVVFSKIVTFWAPGFILKHTGFPAKDMQQAWREKVTLCFLICLICAAVVFLTLFLPKVLCTVEDQSNVSLAFPVKRSNGKESKYNYLF